jgi:mandelate racemase
MQHALDADASDFMMPDVMKIGGISGWMRAAALAQPRNIRLSSHLWPELSAQLLCVTPTAHWLEYADWWNPIMRSPLVINRGMASVEDVLGTGIDWDENAVARYAV